MIYWEENQIAFCRSTDFLKEEKNLLIQLKEKSGKDLIIDCSFDILPLTVLKFIEKFQRTLEKYGVVSTIRATMGDDIDAACGQLARKKKDTQ